MRAVPLAVISFALFLGAAVGVHAGPADLDPTFANGGSLIIPFGGLDALAEAVVLQPDDKIVAAGVTGLDFALARCHPNGGLDPSFGVGGILTTDFGGSDIAHALVLQPDGKLVAAGTSFLGTISLALARYRADGRLDPSFGVGGRVLMPGVNAHALVLQPDGMLVVGGSGASGFMLARYDAAGVLDATFGTGGVASTDFPDSNGSMLLLFGLALQSDGKIVAVGGGGTLIALARFEADGTLDATFGTDGHVTTDVSFGAEFPLSRAYAVLVQPDGKLALAGTASDVTDIGDVFPLTVGSALVLRYDADGALDTTFNSTGIVRLNDPSIDDGPKDARALIMQPDDKLVAIGSSYFRKRLTSDGTVDSSFSSNQDLDGGASALVMQPDLKLVAAGSSPAGTDIRFEIARFGAGDCGNGVVDPLEACDDGNATNGDGCDVNCTPTGCGNNIVTAGEDCERGASPACCTASCAFESAGTPCVSPGSVCGNRQCNATGTCEDVVQPSVVCVAPPARKSFVAISKFSEFSKRSISWTWKGGPVALADLDDPTPTHYPMPYALCVYDHSGATPQLAVKVYVGSPLCPTCWKTSPKGYDYNENAAAVGSTRVVLHASSNGTGSFKVKAKAQFLQPIGSLPMSVDPKVTVQLRNASGDCWGADFSVPTKNDADRFKARSD